MEIPSHIPLQISEDKIEVFQSYLLDKGYQWTFFQIMKPGQLFGLVKEVNYNGLIVDHHVRCSIDGIITTEIELRRIKDIWLHLTTQSISAHERVIPMLEELNICYDINHQTREYYRENGPTEFERDYMEFFRWLFFGVLFWTPIGYLWKISQKLKNNH